MNTEVKGTFKRDFIRDIETKVQAKWQAEGVNELDAPVEGGEVEEKFLATFPYPYMNGKLHLGHAFTASKAEFAVAFERMKGKKALFPFGFHCTGMPIKASADKLKKEMELYGCPPVIPVTIETESTETKVAKHSKVAAKTGNAKLQWDLMKQLGISDEEIPKFADPMFWMDFFPPLAQNDLSSMGFHIDWRRSFITTDKNPFYDSFVRWQFNKLRSQNRIKFGKRHTIYSPLDGQPCMDHDRQTGEGVEPKEYTVVKLQVSEFPEASAVFDSIKDKKVFMAAATLRPETMYGQTNCWVGPEIEYGAYKTCQDDEIIICTLRSARNMAFQGITQEEGKVECITTFKGSDLIGVALSAPNAFYEKIYVLPMFTVSADMGTGVVTSVPSNSPADYVALMEIKDKEALRKKFNIQDRMVLPFQLVQIINSPIYGDFSAEFVVRQLNIKSQNDTINLEKAKEMAYKDDFYSGVMTFGPHIGKSVMDAKNIIRDELIEAGKAFIYFEPEKSITSRSGDECVVALVDQWYIDYGEASWRALAEKCLEKMNVYCEEVRNQFIGTLGWMKQWACSRSFGMGTKLPWDTQFLIESLSDSTIYMAYYSVAHILHQGSLDGSVSPNNITPEQMTDQVWEWIFGCDDSEESFTSVVTASGIPEELLKKMRREFRFWYPMDLRVSGKDLVPNHLTMSIYNHVAIFPEKFWPLGMRANGHLLLNSQKMSKSTGNFMTMEDAVAEFGADATRIALADAGDTVEDANFLKDTANMSILRLYNLIEFYVEMMNSKDTLRQDDGQTVFHDKVFNAEINKAIVATEAAYKVTNYRDALKAGFFEIQNARDLYRDATSCHGSVGMNWNLVKKFMEVQALLLNPIAPHFSEHVWSTVMLKPTSICRERFPKAETIDDKLLAASHYLQSVAHNLRVTLQNEGKPKKGAAVKKSDVPAPNSAEVYVASAYPKWQEDAIAILKASFDGTKFIPDDALVAALKPLMKEKANKKLIPFVMDLKSRVLTQGIQVLERQLSFDEVTVLEENMDYLTRSLGLLQVSIKSVDPSKVKFEEEESQEAKERARRQESSLPGEPCAFFYTSN